MSLTEEQRIIMVQAQMKKCRAAFEECELMMQGERWSGAAGRLYYAVFHAVCALLINDGVAVKSHKGAGISFHCHYMKTGVLPYEYGQLFQRLESLREESDYNCFYDVSSDEVLSRIEPVKQMIAAIGQRIGNEN